MALGLKWLLIAALGCLVNSTPTDFKRSKFSRDSSSLDWPSFFEFDNFESTKYRSAPKSAEREVVPSSYSKEPSFDADQYYDDSYPSTKDVRLDDESFSNNWDYNRFEPPFKNYRDEYSASPEPKVTSTEAPRTSPVPKVPKKSVLQKAPVEAPLNVHLPHPIGKPVNSNPPPATAAPLPRIPPTPQKSFQTLGPVGRLQVPGGVPASPVAPGTQALVPEGRPAVAGVHLAAPGVKSVAVPTAGIPAVPAAHSFPGNQLASGVPTVGGAHLRQLDPVPVHPSSKVAPVRPGLPGAPAAPLVTAHRLEPKRTMKNGVKMLLGKEPEYETLAEHMKRRHESLATKIGGGIYNYARGQWILNLFRRSDN